MNLFKNIKFHFLHTALMSEECYLNAFFISLSKYLLILFTCQEMLHVRALHTRSQRKSLWHLRIVWACSCTSYAFTEEVNEIETVKMIMSKTCIFLKSLCKVSNWLIEHWRKAISYLYTPWLKKITNKGVFFSCE